MKKILAILSILLILTSCSAQKTEPKYSGETINITVTGLDGEVILSAKPKHYDGITVLDALLQCAKEDKIPVVHSGGKSSTYVTSIGGLAQLDHGPESGWIYTLNGESVMTPCSTQVLNPNDVVEWTYITEFN